MGFLKRKQEISIELGPKIFKALVEVMADPSGQTEHINISFGGRDIKQQLWIVGESNFQDELRKFKTGWSYGFLIPEQDNPHDKFAVALYLIGEDYEVCKVGYLKKETAKNVSQPIANLIANKGRLIPTLCMVEGEGKDKPNIGVRAWARTDEVNFSSRN